MKDKEFANIAARAAMTGIEVTRRGVDSFNVTRGQSQFWFRLPGDTHFSRTAGCRHLAKEVQAILQAEIPGVDVVATGRWFRTVAAPVARHRLTIF